MLFNNHHFRSQFLDARVGSLLKVHQLHREAHVALHLHLALEESLLRVQLAGYQIHHVDIVHDERNVRFVRAAVLYRALADFRIDHPVALGTVRSVRDLEPVDTAHTLNQVVLIVAHRFLEHLHVRRDQEPFRCILQLAGCRKAWVDGTFRVREAQPVQPDHDRSTKADVMLQRQFGALHLTLVRLTAQLPAQLRTLRQARRAERMSLGDQTTARVDNHTTTVRVVATVNELACLAWLAQPERFVRDQLVSGEAIVQLDHIDVLRFLSEATMQQAAPSLVGQHCSLCSGLVPYFFMCSTPALPNSWAEIGAPVISWFSAMAVTSSSTGFVRSRYFEMGMPVKPISYRARWPQVESPYTYPTVACCTSLYWMPASLSAFVTASLAICG
uniref:Uncharacterized protein n=1 Tax=Anopheles dirus TaxID=7168 RepID=A0A182NXB3_9DIPT